jgi:hypothetical protein
MNYSMRWDVEPMSDNRTPNNGTKKRPTRRAFAWRKRKGSMPRRDTIPRDLGDFDPDGHYGVLRLPHSRGNLDSYAGIFTDD